MLGHFNGVYSELLVLHSISCQQKPFPTISELNKAVNKMMYRG